MRIDYQVESRAGIHEPAAFGPKRIYSGRTKPDLTKLVSSAGVSDDAGSSALTGFSIVKADDMDAALEMARACPFLDCGGERRLTTRRRGHSGASKKKAALGRPAFGAGNEIRTHDFNLGKVALYR